MITNCLKKCLFALPVILVGFTSCSDDSKDSPTPVPTPAPEPPAPPVSQTIDFNSPAIFFDSEGIWSDYMVNDNFIYSGFTFRHYLTEWMTVEGFVPSKNSDTGFHNPMYLHPYTVEGGEGIAGPGSAYLVASWSTNEDPANPSLIITRTDGKPFVIENITVNNTTYAAYTMRDGNDFCQPFKKGDWFKLTAHGISADGIEKTADFMLADCKENQPAASDKEIEGVAKGIVSTWQVFDLSSLGEIASLHFTFSSSDTGQWGMNTPGYFAIGSITYKTGGN